MKITKGRIKTVFIGIIMLFLTAIAILIVTKYGYRDVFEYVKNGFQEFGVLGGLLRILLCIGICCVVYYFPLLITLFIINPILRFSYYVYRKYLHNWEGTSTAWIDAYEKRTYHGRYVRKTYPVFHDNISKMFNDIVMGLWLIWPLLFDIGWIIVQQAIFEFKHYPSLVRLINGL